MSLGAPVTCGTCGWGGRSHAGGGAGPRVLQRLPGPLAPAAGAEEGPVPGLPAQAEAPTCLPAPPEAGLALLALSAAPQPFLHRSGPGEVPRGADVLKPEGPLDPRCTRLAWARSCPFLPPAPRGLAASAQLLGIAVFDARAWALPPAPDGGPRDVWRPRGRRTGTCQPGPENLAVTSA